MLSFSQSSPRPRAPVVYSKDLDVKLQVRITSQDADFLRWLADGYGLSLSGAMRLVVRAYRSNLDAQDDVLNVLAPGNDISMPPVGCPDKLL